MKRLLFPALLLLCLFGCRTAGKVLPETAPDPPPIVQMSSPETDPEPPSSSVGAATGRSPEATAPDAPAEPSNPTVRAAIGRPPEATAPDAPVYPADPDCSDEELLGKWLAAEGLDLADLEALGCWQLILVSAQPGEAPNRTLTVCYERGLDGGFAPAAGLSRMRGWVGKNGIRRDRRRNTNTTPAGLWPLGYAFGNETPPEGLKLPWRQVGPDSDWVCDEDSRFFNTWQERGDPAVPEGWSEDVEHLEDYPKQYAFACVIGFNRPPDTVPDRGYAIFLHCSEGPTGGCVGLPRADMLSVLRWLNGEKQPYILITGVQSDP